MSRWWTIDTVRKKTVDLEGMGSTGSVVATSGLYLLCWRRPTPPRRRPRELVFGLKDIESSTESGRRAIKY